MLPEKIEVSSVNELVSVVDDFKNIYNSTANELQDLAKDEKTPFVKRKFIQLMTSDDEKLSFDAIKWLHGIVTAENVELNIQNTTDINHVTGTLNLTIDQNAIYKVLKKENKNCLSGDDYLLKALAINMDLYNQSMRIINLLGLKMTYKTGAQQIRPEFTIVRECTRNIDRIIEQLGLSTASRARLKLEMPETKGGHELDDI